MTEKQEIFYVSGMNCASCSGNVEQALSEKEGVRHAKVNFAASTVWVDYNPESISPADLQQIVKDAGYDLILEDDSEENQAEILQREEYRSLKAKTTGAILLALPVFIIGMFFMHMPYGTRIMLAFTLPILLIFGRVFFRQRLETTETWPRKYGYSGRSQYWHSFLIQFI